jgi:hypothetical protein
MEEKMEENMEGRTEDVGRKEGWKMKEGRREGRKTEEGRKEGGLRKEGRKGREGRTNSPALARVEESQASIFARNQ